MFKGGKPSQRYVPGSIPGAPPGAAAAAQPNDKKKKRTGRGKVDANGDAGVPASAPVPRSNGTNTPSRAVSSRGEPRQNGKTNGAPPAEPLKQMAGLELGDAVDDAIQKKVRNLQKKVR